MSRGESAQQTWVHREGERRHLTGQPLGQSIPPPSAEGKPTLFMRIEALNTTIAELHQVMGMLQARLAPLLDTPMPDEVPRPVDSSEAMSASARLLNVGYVGVLDAIRLVHSLMARIDV